MLEINIEEDQIIIRETKKKIFSKEVITKERNIEIKNLSKIVREEYQGNLNSISLYTKDGQEEFFTTKQIENLETIFSEIVSLKKTESNFQVNKMDIETLEETEII